MERQPNTQRSGQPFSDSVKLSLWNSARIIPNYSPLLWRSDKYGKVIKWSDYGNRDSLYGWEIDHIIPIARGGTDELTNLQALNWKNNVEKGDNLNWNPRRLIRVRRA